MPLPNLQKPKPRVLTKRFQALEKARQFREAHAFVKTRDKGKCRACGKPGNQAHHLVYRSHGGSDRPENLVWCCARCHVDIHAKVWLVHFDERNPAKTVKFTRNTQWD
jgi:hypothetical protein